MIAIHCSYDELIPLNDLSPHPKNPNRHSDDQLARLVKILMYQGIRRPIRVSKRSKYITAGHGLLQALKIAGVEKAPVNWQEYQDEDQEYADIISDNSIAAWAELDLAAINLELPNFDPSFDIDVLGIKNFTVDMSEKQKKQRQCPHCGKEI